MMLAPVRNDPHIRPIRCWRCGKTMLRVTITAIGTGFVKCTRCGSYNIVDFAKETGIR